MLGAVRIFFCGSNRSGIKASPRRNSPGRSPRASNRRAKTPMTACYPSGLCIEHDIDQTFVPSVVSSLRTSSKDARSIACARILGSDRGCEPTGPTRNTSAPVRERSFLGSRGLVGAFILMIYSMASHWPSRAAILCVDKAIFFIYLTDGLPSASLPGLEVGTICCNRQNKNGRPRAPV